MNDPQADGRRRRPRRSVNARLGRTGFRRDDRAKAVEDVGESGDDGSDKTGLWGLLGLAGLAGLAGLKRRDREVETAPYGTNAGAPTAKVSSQP
jgi:MYXO-CTERM domain-containing protein